MKQPELDFVDVDVRGDTKLFVDPRALLLLPTEWGEECVALVQDFFGTVMGAIQAGDQQAANRMLGQLREPNETRLGLSRDRAQGHALGPQLAERVGDSLARSEAAKTGLLEDLEDTILLVPNVDADLVSDITTNVIREPLVRYTREAARELGIAVVRNVSSGGMWDPARHEWYAEYVDLPVADGRPLLFVPKVIIRKRMEYNADEYYNHYILERLRADEFAAGSDLVQILKNGKTRVTDKELMAKYGRGKLVNAHWTRIYPQLLDQYRRDHDRSIRPPLTHHQLAEELAAPEPDYEALLAAVLAVPRGRADADRYHRAAQDLLTTLFYPALSMGRRERPIHGGRKRIDIVFANTATAGFFAWLRNNYPAANIIVECKNYEDDPANGELDQLAGRFAPSRGIVGLLLCRQLTDRSLFIARCRDAANDQGGFIVALDDSDLRILVDARQAGDEMAQFEYLKGRFDELVM
jgi:hypothetical protein